MGERGDERQSGEWPQVLQCPAAREQRAYMPCTQALSAQMRGVATQECPLSNEQARDPALTA